MKAPVFDALDFCLLLRRACARIELSVEERLGDFHGLDFADFGLLHGLAAAPEGVVVMEDFAQALGIKLSSLTRKMVQLEKVGLAQRGNGRSGDGPRCASLSSAGKRLLQESETTARAACSALVEKAAFAHSPEMALLLAALCGEESPRGHEAGDMGRAP